MKGFWGISGQICIYCFRFTSRISRIKLQFIGSPFSTYMSTLYSIWLCIQGTFQSNQNEKENGNQKKTNEAPLETQTEQKCHEKVLRENDTN